MPKNSKIYWWLNESGIALITPPFREKVEYTVHAPIVLGMNAISSNFARLDA